MFTGAKLVRFVGIRYRVHQSFTSPEVESLYVRLKLLVELEPFKQCNKITEYVITIIDKAMQ